MPTYTHAAHNPATDALVKWTDEGQFVIIGDDSQITDRTLVNLVEGNLPPGWNKAPATPAEIITAIPDPPRPTRTRQHTSAPWHVGPTSNPDTEFCVSDSDGTIICRFDLWKGGAEVEQDANAKLIAAAPDLLAACQMLMLAYEGGEPGESIDWEDIDDVVEAAREAIQKATGSINA